MRLIDFEIVAARREDAEFVAWTVLTALDLPLDDLQNVERSCADEETLYSWRNALLAKVEGRIVGCLVAYDGKDYLRKREYTWRGLWGDCGDDYLSSIAKETGPGEYYLDSMAILPEYRGHEIGKRLMEAAMALGKSKGIEIFSLIVDVHKPHLQSYYENLGFRYAEDITFFGHKYYKLKIED